MITKLTREQEERIPETISKYVDTKKKTIQEKIFNSFFQNRIMRTSQYQHFNISQLFVMQIVIKQSHLHQKIHQK